MPALVWTFRNSQRGLTRNVSNFVILSGSFWGIGASLPTRSWAAASSWEKAAHPRLAKAPARTERRLTAPWVWQVWLRMADALLNGGSSQMGHYLRALA